MNTPNRLLKEGAGLGLCPLFFLLFILPFLASCTKSQVTSLTDPAREALIKRGRAVYQTSCVACHNPDPKKVGALGPEIYGSSLELIEARVLRAEYPAGYKPKRTSKLMAPLPQFKSDIDGLHAYLNQ